MFGLSSDVQHIMCNFKEVEAYDFLMNYEDHQGNSRAQGTHPRDARRGHRGHY